MNVRPFCDRLIRFGYILLFLLVPIILTPWNYELFEYNKMMLTYGAAALITGAWIVEMFAAREIKIAKTPFDIPIGLFFLSQLVSSIFSIDPHISWFGYYSRFNGGMWSVISYIALYYAFVTNFGNELSTLTTKATKKAKLVQANLPRAVFPRTLIHVALGSAAIVALYGAAEHFGIDKHVWVQDVQSRVFSTLGQPNWLAAYLVGLLPVSLYFATKHEWKLTRKAILQFISAIVSILFFIVLLFTRSRSGYLGFAIADIILWIFLFVSSSDKKHLKVPCIITHVLFLAIVFINGTSIDFVDRYFSLQSVRDRLTTQTKIVPKQQPVPSGTTLETGGTESGTIRKYVWQGAVNAWRSSTKTLLIGTGTETFAFAFYQYRPAGHNLTSEWDFLYNKAHNEYLNYLATTGIFGLGAYLFLIGSVIFWFLSKIRQSDNWSFTAALFAGWVSVLVTNFFGFSVVVVQLFFFLFPALMLATGGNLSYRTRPLRSYTTAGQWIAGVLTVIWIIFLLRYWQADTLFASGYRLARGGQLTEARSEVLRAIALNSAEPLYHDELASTLGSLAAAAVDQKNATIGAQLFKQSLDESNTSLSISPNNVNYWKTRTKLYYAFSAYEPSLNDAAIDALVKAQSLSPNDPKIAYNIAILYGRGGKYDEALKQLLKAKSLKRDYRDAYFGLYVFYTELNNPTEARAVLEEYLKNVDENDKDFQERLIK